jgi:hypothetical protein
MAVRRPRPYRYADTTPRTVAGAWCLVDPEGNIVRAALVNGRHGEAAVWVAGEGEVWSRAPQLTGLVPVHYAS